MFARAGLAAALVGLWGARRAAALDLDHEAVSGVPAVGGLADDDESPPFSPPLDSLVGIRIYGTGGKFSVYSNALGEDDPNAVSVTMDYLHEIDAQGNQVGTADSEKHSIDSFASQTFAIAGPEAVDEPSASRISFGTDVGPSVGVLTVETLVLLSDEQSVGPPGDEWSAMAGDLKWNIVLSNWRFCDPCQQGQEEEVGAYIDLAVEVKANASPVSAPGEGPANLTQHLGGGIHLELTQRLTVDGVEAEMPAGYPKEQSDGSKRLLIFRFPKFNSSVLYDPLIRTSGSLSLAPTPAPTPAPGPPFSIRWDIIVGIVLGILAVLACLALLLYFFVPSEEEQEQRDAEIAIQKQLQEEEFLRADGMGASASLEMMPYI